MAKKKESALKAAGRFVTDELLGVDDAKRAFNKARKGDIKGALKSAATGVLEAGTTLTGAGLGAKVGAKVGLKAGKAVREATAKRVEQEAGKRMASKLPKPKYPSGEAKIKTIRADKVQVKAKSGSKSTTPNAKNVTIVKPKPSEKKRLGTYNAQVKKRNAAIDKASSSAGEASRSTSRAPSAGRATGKVSGAVAGTAAVASTKRVDKNPKKKTGK